MYIYVYKYICIYKYIYMYINIYYRKKIRKITSLNK